MWSTKLMCLCLCTHVKGPDGLKRTLKLVALLLLSYRCIVTINVLWLFLTASWVGLQCVIVVFPDNTHLLFAMLWWWQNLAYHQGLHNKS